ncbi:MAG: hypothetical protein HY900_25020 [Deltaproteobacteria bacterium]|nr:hypothetical protein [Deltaproteobacteria bacterium]
MKRQRRSLWMALVLVLLVGAQLCRAESKDQLVLCQGGELPSFDPARMASSHDFNIGNRVFDLLYFWDQKGTPQPRVAQSHKLVNDTTWEFKLRKGIKFHDGSPLNAADVKFSIERMIDPATKAVFASFYTTIKEVKVVDDLTVQVVTKAPDPILLKRLSLLMYILPSDLVQKQGAEAFFQRPVGSGAWKFVSWNRNDRIVLEANESHWAGAPKIPRLVIRPVPEVAARVAELQTGNADVVTSIPPFLVPRLKESPNVAVHPMQTGRVLFIMLNTNGQDALKNKKVRQAMNYAIDRKALTEKILLGSAAPSGVGISPLHFGYDAGIKPYPYDPAMAKKLLAEAGYPNGFKIEFNSPSGKYLMDKEVAEAVAKMLNGVGIQTELKVLEWGTHMQIITGKKLKDAAFIGFGNVLSDADATLSMFYNPQSSSSYFSTASLTDKITQARSTMDPKKRLALYKKIQEELYDEAPMIYLYQQFDNYGSGKGLKGLELWDEYFTFRNVTK